MHRKDYRHTHRERERKEKDDDDDSFGGGVFGTVSFERHRSGRERSLVRTLALYFFPGAAAPFLDTSPRRRRRDDGEGFTFGRRIRVHVEAREARGVVSVDRGESVERADRDEEEDGRWYDF